MKCTVKRWSPTCLPGCYTAADNKSKREKKKWYKWVADRRGHRLSTHHSSPCFYFFYIFKRIACIPAEIKETFSVFCRPSICSLMAPLKIDFLLFIIVFFFLGMKDDAVRQSNLGLPSVCFRRRFFFFVENWVRSRLRRQLKGLNWATSRVCERKPVAINERQHVMGGKEAFFFFQGGRMFVSLNISTTEKQSKSQHASGDWERVGEGETLFNIL